MNQKEKQLVNYLLNQNETLTSKDLSAALGFSVRTVKSCVQSINRQAKSPLVASSFQGYTINRSLALELLKEENPLVPQGRDQRINYIRKQLLLHHGQDLDLYTLCEQLFVNYSTIKADIGVMNRMYSNFPIQFVCHSDKLSIKGTERAIRKFISFSVYDEAETNFMDISLIESSFPDLDIRKLAELVIKAFKNQNYYVNDFAMINVVLHLAILIDRIRDGGQAKAGVSELAMAQGFDLIIANKIADAIEKEFSVLVPPLERFEVYTLIKTNANYIGDSKTDEVKELIGSNILKQAMQIIKEVNNTYLVDLSSENFLIPFALHLKNLLARLERGTFIHNPMTDNIKKTCPTIYDIAIFVAIRLMDQYHYIIREDEISFIALHIGSEIERWQPYRSKIKTVLLCPSYLELPVNIRRRLMMEFSEDMEIVHTVSQVSELSDLEFDLLISTMAVPLNANYLCVEIAPLAEKMNLALIQDAIKQIQLKQLESKIKKEFDSIFAEKLFFAKTKIRTKAEAIHMLCENLRALKYVDKEFEATVLKREEAASTAFDLVAIPHSVEMNSVKTCISVLLSKEGIEWDSHKVHIVLLVAFNAVSKNYFHDIYESLINLFSEHQAVLKVSQCIDYQSFKSTISYLLG
ncbi:MAG: PRD domain-containing protein [Erysipelotrichaceae bacterium]|jgi:lichenan operon transcriptional antiterminator|nr:PRD domain-containing protein [Erysipelotrichaceae bacterium]